MYVDTMGDVDVSISMAYREVENVMAAMIGGLVMMKGPWRPWADPGKAD
jgi:hypothetical protein